MLLYDYVYCASLRSYVRFTGDTNRNTMVIRLRNVKFFMTATVYLIVPHLIFVY